MSDYIVIEEDRVKLALYTAGNLILTLVLMFICADFQSRSTLTSLILLKYYGL